MIREGTTLILRYEYDGLDQLIREDNLPLGKSYTYEYDTAGNITVRKEYLHTTSDSLGEPTSVNVYKN